MCCTPRPRAPSPSAVKIELLDLLRAGEYMLLPLYVWNALFVLGTCAMSPWVFTSNIFWLALMPTSILLGASVMAEVVMTGVRVSEFFFFSVIIP